VTHITLTESVENKVGGSLHLEWKQMC